MQLMMIIFKLMDKVEKYLSYLYNFDRKDKGKSLIIILSIVFIVVAYSIGTGKIYEDFNKFYSNKSFFPNFEEIAKGLYNVYDYIICFTVMTIATAWLRKSNNEWSRKIYEKMQEEEEKKLKEEEAKQKRSLETINEENEDEEEKTPQQIN
jgi:hypothetical protein